MDTRNNTLKVVAIVAIRNGAFYFPRLCEHARKNGFTVAVIDNQSEDQLHRFVLQNQDVVEATMTLEFDGTFDLTRQLQAKQELVHTLNADWFIHLDVDELPYSNVENETLLQAIQKAHQGGFNSLNFDEFVFLPTEVDKRFTPTNYHSMRHYYFFEPWPQRLIRAFHRTLSMDVASGGHGVAGDLNLYHENMILRHYMFKDLEHMKTKYRDRQYSEQDKAQGFHSNRASISARQIKMPEESQLKVAAPEQWLLDKTQPMQAHFWDW